MYIWFAINVDRQLKSLREGSADLTRTLGTENTALTLPLHISLRISFPVEKALLQAVVERLCRYFETLEPFSVAVEGLEQNGSIVWLKIRENQTLQRIHSQTVQLLQEEYGVETHPFDRQFYFHVTLLHQADPALAQKFYAQMVSQPLPDILEAETLVIGCSESGLAGEYRVIREVKL